MIAYRKHKDRTRLHMVGDDSRAIERFHHAGGVFSITVAGNPDYTIIRMTSAEAEAMANRILQIVNRDKVA